MRAPVHHSGFFTPEELAKMQDDLNKEAPPAETPAERENRALALC